MCSDRNKGIDVVFSDDGHCTLSTVHPDLGTGQSWIPCKFEAEVPRSLLLNHKYLFEALGKAGKEVILSVPENDGRMVGYP